MRWEPGSGRRPAASPLLIWSGFSTCLETLRFIWHRRASIPPWWTCARDNALKAPNLMMPRRPRAQVIWDARNGDQCVQVDFIA
jgi:hypothetical protein